jgi:hypothetical protein
MPSSWCSAEQGRVTANPSFSRLSPAGKQPNRGLAHSSAAWRRTIPSNASDRIYLHDGTVFGVVRQVLASRRWRSQGRWGFLGAVATQWHGIFHPDGCAAAIPSARWTKRLGRGAADTSPGSITSRGFFPRLHGRDETEDAQICHPPFTSRSRGRDMGHFACNPAVMRATPSAQWWSEPDVLQVQQQLAGPWCWSKASIILAKSRSER